MMCGSALDLWFDVDLSADNDAEWQWVW